MIFSSYRYSPVYDQRGFSGSNSQLWFSTTDVQGWRFLMEDRHKMILNLNEGTDAKTVSYLGLFDGHGGWRSAAHAAENLPKKLLDEEAYHKHDYAEALKRAFLAMDKEICSDPRKSVSGTTALVTLLSDDVLYIANAGDSRAVICRGGLAEDLSSDHIPSRQNEHDRIVKAGGFITKGRINGNLAVSRGLGDMAFKKNQDLSPEEQMVTAVPDVKVFPLTSEDEFFVLASDGLWDCYTSQQLIDIIRYHISLGATLMQTSTFICNISIAPMDWQHGRQCLHGTDNMTLIIVAILHGKTEMEWMKWISERVRAKSGYETSSTIPQLYPVYGLSPIEHPAQISPDFDLRLRPPLMEIPPIDLQLLKLRTDKVLFI